MRTVKTHINRQGGVVVNHAGLYRTGKNVRVFLIDLEQKNAKVSATMGCDDEGPGVVLDPEGAAGVPKGRELQDTYLVFPGYPGWTVLTAQVSRYTLIVCLTRN